MLHFLNVRDGEERGHASTLETCCLSQKSLLETLIFSSLFLTKRFFFKVLNLQLPRVFDIKHRLLGSEDSDPKSPQIPLSSPLGTARWASCVTW